jgi:oxygen-independent coproporphyrinogen III oxidase
MHLYLHIPFCKQACHYCDFHFSTNRSRQPELIRAMCREISLQADYLPTRRLETVYFGGGTPSLLTEADLELIFGTIHREFTLVHDAENRPPEITLEANPDDLTPDKLRLFLRYVNRLSIGIQTFDEPTLRWMNRAHTATEAETCVRRAQDAGFDNLSVDLLYGIPAAAIPDRPATGWQTDLSRMLDLNVAHLSAYCLTIEPGTAFGRWQDSGKLLPTDEAVAASQFTELTTALIGAGYEQYEISSFARAAPGRPGHYARHNTAYWQQRPYLGIGPGAHSYNGLSRQANISSNALYMSQLSEDKLPATVEVLSPADRVNDYLLTGLRTRWGCSLTNLTAWLGTDFALTQRAEIADMQRAGWLTRQADTLLLTHAGMLFADRVAATLFV